MRIVLVGKAKCVDGCDSDPEWLLVREMVSLARERTGSVTAAISNESYQGLRLWRLLCWDSTLGCVCVCDCVYLFESKLQLGKI